MRSLRVAVSNRTLPQLYRFCYLMTGDGAKAQDVFQATVREAALRSAHGEPPSNRLWFYRDARWRCLEATSRGLQAEMLELEEHELSAGAPNQIGELSAEQLAIWVSSAPEPQRSALALYYLDELTLREMLAVLELKLPDLARLLRIGRREFQAWLNATIGHDDGT